MYIWLGTKTNTQSNTKTRRTPICNRHLENTNYLFCFFSRHSANPIQIKHTLYLYRVLNIVILCFNIGVDL